MKKKIENTHTFQLLILYFSNNFDIFDYVGKLPEQHITVWLFSNSNLGDILFLLFNEARISEWNVGKSLCSFGQQCHSLIQMKAVP